MKTVYVVTDTNLGWDCVVGVFDNEKAAYHCVNSLGYTDEEVDAVIHEMTVESEFKN